MDQEKTKRQILELQRLCSESYDVAKKANKSKKSLSGDNFYGNKFHELVVEITKLENAIQPALAALYGNDADFKAFNTALNTLKSTSVKPPQKSEALRHVKEFSQAKILPHLEVMNANPVPLTEQVIPLEVVKDGRLKKLAMQINGCYERRWYDACSVMMRRITEVLIIDSYIEKGKAAEIKDSNGDFFMLRDLVNTMTNDPSWHLGRTTKKTLPQIKELGDLSAHNRHYIATKNDVDKISQDFRVTIEELVNHAGYK